MKTGKALIMNSNDLFSFLDEAPAEDDAMQTDPPTSPKLKRKAGSPNGHQSPRNGDVPMQELHNEPGPSAPKKSRMASPKPVVLDDFETEAKREVAASAGLSEAVEAGSRLELKHQVCDLHTHVL